MSNDRDPYSRHYWKLVDDPKFDEIYSDDHHYATWARLLMLADQAWPASAHIPASARKSSIRKLAEVELIDLLPGGRFRMHGLQSERERRQQHAANAAAARWGIPSTASGNADSNAPSNAQTMPSKAEQSKSIEEQSSTPATRAPDPADVYWTLTGRYPTDKVLGWLDQLSSEYGQLEVIKAVSTAHVQDRNAATLLGRTTDVLRAEARALSLKAQETERQRLKERRAAPREIVDPAAVQAEVQKILRGEAA